MKVVGYTDPMSVRAGERLAFRVSSRSPSYAVQMVRLVHGDENPLGPGFKAEAVDADVNGTRPGVHRTLRSGSYVRLERDQPLRRLHSFTLGAWIFPTALGRGIQAVVGAFGLPGSGYCLMVGEDGRLQLRLADSGGGVHAVQAPAPLSEREWQFVAASFSAESRRVTLMTRRQAAFAPGQDITTGKIRGAGPLGDVLSPFLIAAHAAGSGEAAWDSAAHFNGKIESPAALSVALGGDELAALADGPRAGDTVAAWDFSAMPTSRSVLDRSRHGLQGRTVNMPTRGVTGHLWDGSMVDFKERPEQFAAIHFHDDDLDDAGWPTDFAWNIPPGRRSGIYAARLATADGGLDHVPFFVRPAR